MFRMEGCLTKEPSEALKRVIKMMQSPEHSCPHQSPLESFFLVGVQEQQPVQVEDRVVTPFRERNETLRRKNISEGAKSARQEKEAIKISNRCELIFFFISLLLWYDLHKTLLSTLQKNYHHPEFHHQ